MGIATYPLRGVYKSIWASAKSHTRHSIKTARRSEGSYFAANARGEGMDQVVMDTFDALK